MKELETKINQYKFFFHIGYPRTGTTFLQKYIFPQYLEEAIFSLPYPPKFYNLEEVNSTENVNTLAKLSDFLIKYKDEKNKPVIFSSEDFSGNVFHDDLRMPGLIKRHFPQSKIIVCIRSQYTIIPSLYSYCYIKEGGTLSYIAYLKKIIANSKLDYLSIVSNYQKLFGRDAVYVIFYEDLKKDQEKFLAGLFNFIGLPHKWDLTGEKQHKNLRFPMIVVKGSRIVNLILARKAIIKILNKTKPYGLTDSKIRNIARIGCSYLNSFNDILKIITPVSFEDNSQYQKLIKDCYAKSNDRLFDLLNIDPTCYDYPL